VCLGVYVCMCVCVCVCVCVSHRICSYCHAAVADARGHAKIDPSPTFIYKNTFVYTILILLYNIRLELYWARDEGLSLSLTPPPSLPSLPLSLPPFLSLPPSLSPWPSRTLAAFSARLAKSSLGGNMCRIRARMGKWSTGANVCREHATRRAVTLHALRAGFPPRGQTNGP
jgi:hypothetical protein